jgi:Integrase repeat unit
LRFKRSSVKSFAEARAFVRTLGLKNQGEWRAYCRSGQKLADIPSGPQSVYRTEWSGWGDWLGTGTIAHRDRQYRPFAEARAFVHRLGLKNQREWFAYRRSGQKPADIPGKPHSVYRTEWSDLGDWLGTGTIAHRDRQYRPFAEARAFVHPLGLKTKDEWGAYCRSGQKPVDIPAAPQAIYRTKWGGWGHWLGVVNQWTKVALLEFLNGLRPLLARLSETELYVLLQQGGQVPALRAALQGAPVTAVLRDLTRNEGRSLAHALAGANEQTVQREADQYLADDLVPEIADDLSPPAGMVEPSPLTMADPLPLVRPPPDDLRIIDDLATLSSGEDEEAVEYLVGNRVAGLWVRYINGGRASVDPLLHGDGGRWFYGCMTRHLRGDAICANALEVRLDDAEEAVLAAVERDVLNVAVLETSLAKAMAAFQASATSTGAATQAAVLRDELAQLEAEVTRLATAIAAGGDLPALVAAMQERERRRASLRAELAALERQTSMRRDVGTVARTLDIMRTALTDWQGMLRQEPPEARRALRALLAGRLVFTPATGFYTFEGPGTITPVLAGVVGACAKGVVAPTGFEPVFWP